MKNRINKGTVLRIVLFIVCMVTILFTIMSHGTLTIHRIFLFVVSTIAGVILIVLFDKLSGKGIGIDKFLSIHLKSGKKIVDIVSVIIIIIAALFIRISFLHFETEDGIGFFAYWVEVFRHLGVKTSLGANITDYSPLYTTVLTILSVLPFSSLTVVKIVPIVCDFLIGLGGVFLYNYSKGTEATSIGRIGVIFFTLLNPISVLNSAAWGQCDSVYAAPLIFGIYFLAKLKQEDDKFAEYAVIMFALAFSIKLQAIFSLPLLLFVYVSQRRTDDRNGIRLSQFIWFPIIYFISAIPMFLCGKTLGDIVRVYVDETGEYNHKLTLRYYNFYTIMGDKVDELNFDGFFMFGVVLAVMVLFFVYYLIYRKGIKLDTNRLLALGSLTVLTLNYFLPSMHERYAYVGEILLLILACITTKYSVSAVVTIVCTLSAYGDYLTNGQLSVMIPDWLVAILRLTVIIYIVYVLMNPSKDISDKLTAKED